MALFARVAERPRRARRARARRLDSRPSSTPPTARRWRSRATLGGWDVLRRQLALRRARGPVPQARADRRRRPAARRRRRFADLDRADDVRRQPRPARAAARRRARVRAADWSRGSTRGELIEHGSPEEVEIRACALHAVELIVAARGRAPCRRRGRPAAVEPRAAAALQGRRRGTAAAAPPTDARRRRSSALLGAVADASARVRAIASAPGLADQQLGLERAAGEAGRAPGSGRRRSARRRARSRSSRRRSGRWRSRSRSPSRRRRCCARDASSLARRLRAAAVERVDQHDGVRAARGQPTGLVDDRLDAPFCGVVARRRS